MEKFHPHDAEVRVLTIGGRAVAGATDSDWVLVVTWLTEGEKKWTWWNFQVEIYVFIIINT